MLRIGDMRKSLGTTSPLIAIAVFAASCSATGEGYRANSYSTQQVNTRQEARVIEIVTATPAKIIVDNSEQKQKAQIGGATLGALAGGLAGGLGGLSSGGTAGTTIAGGVVGAAAGSMAPDSVPVDGVTIAYRDGQNGRIFTSSQVGQTCEFVPGPSLLVWMADGPRTSTGEPVETRVQPNSTCPQHK